jgi:hypothetical protein
LAFLALGVPGGAASSEIFSFSSLPSTTQAGAHPTVITAFELGNHIEDASPPPCNCNDPKNIHIHAPAGVIANPHVVSICSAADFAAFSCSADSQVGMVVFKFNFDWATVPLYRVEPQAGQAALFAYTLPTVTPIGEYISVTSRTGGDYGLDFRQDGINHTATPPSVTTVFWGVPGESRHDPLRFSPGEKAIGCQSKPLDRMLEDVLPADCLAIRTEGSQTIQESKKPVSSSLPVKPFTQNPTTCVGSLTSTIDVLAYDGESTQASAPWPATTGCDKLSFNPSLAAQPTTTEADSASGLAVDLTVPQFEDPNTPSPSELRASSITLPPGFTINSNAADGKDSCPDLQANLTNEASAQCSEFSKVGTTLLESSALPGPIGGYIYLGEPKPNNRYRVILTASGFGTNVKIVGSVHADSQTGQLSASFENLPQAPFQEFNLHFFGSERGLLATPTQCGTYPVKATFQPWARELSDQTSTQFFTIDSGPEGRPCPNGPRPFSPDFEAGVQDNTAAAHSPFILRLGRADGDQNLSGLSARTPPGFSATLAGIPYCPEAAIAQLGSPAYSGLAEQSSPACPVASQVGTASAAAGAGSRPLHVTGRVYLAGPYKRAPLSLLVVIPAVSGPYDLGAVAVRAAIEVDPLTAQVTAASDPFPQSLAGVPLRTRSLRIDLDRDHFTLNPSDCRPFSVASSLSGDEGATATPSVHFQVANCRDLAFAPRLSLRLSGGLNRLGHPAVHARLSAKPGEANLRAVSVTLPKGELLDNSHIGTVCTKPAFASDRCPASSRIGQAKVVSPLLDQPLAGPVYLRSSDHLLPDLALDLNGQVEIEAVAKIDSVDERFRATVSSIPDVPVSTIALSLAGGHAGLLQNSKGLCQTKKTVIAKLRAHNGARLSRKVRLTLDCKSSSRRRRSARAQRHRLRPNYARSLR